MADYRRLVDTTMYRDETSLTAQLKAEARLSDDDRRRIGEHAAHLVQAIRGKARPGLMEAFLAEYGLSTDEGIALMCLAEALLRVPDAETIDALIEDKIAPSDWGKHLGQSSSSLVNASTWALMLTGKVLDDNAPGPVGALKGAVKRLGEPVIRTAVGHAMKEMGRQFVLGETIESALRRAQGMEAKGYTYSYDMLGEAAKTAPDALEYFNAYKHAIEAIGAGCSRADIRDNPGISVKLSALHPRYELAHKERVLKELAPRLTELAVLAKATNMGLNIDAEEADRLSLSLDVIEAVLFSPELDGWDGFGVVVQAYGKRAGATIDYLYTLADRLNRKIMVRLVKGAYWDTEIKRAQVLGVDGFPVFTSKAATDISFIANARKLLQCTDRIYPQFATHNAHTAAAVLEMADTTDKFEFQRLHGMGEALHDILVADHNVRCRIYAPVGVHRDLLAYLVRRLLENGANSSFVNQIVDEDIPPELVARDPFDEQASGLGELPTGPNLFGAARKNSQGFDLRDIPTLEAIETARAPFRTTAWHARPLIASAAAPDAPQSVENPFDPSDEVGTIAHSSRADVETALTFAQPWDAPVSERAKILKKAADLYEEHFGMFFALLHREAGKSPLDAVAEVREAVDFLRFYSTDIPGKPPLGLFTCISPWNFPLAIFTGQVSAALATGNAVLAKPADQTPLIAFEAVKLLHQAGVPREVLQFLPGDGPTIGAALTSDPRVNGVVFTGSTQTAKRIHTAVADHLAPGTPLIAETGGLNAMIVDSTALPEQTVTAIVESAFQSAGQRCSALRCLYLQEDIADSLLAMLKGAMDELYLGDPWEYRTDCGPVIDDAACNTINKHINTAKHDGRLLHQLPTPQTGTFVAPTLIRIASIRDLEQEIFGPVLHVVTFKAEELYGVIDDINDTGYGLTFGLQTRIDDRVQDVCDRIHAGNIYVNRNQIGAIVGSQPFGGEGLSGTGPKAGGPHYLYRFCAQTSVYVENEWDASVSIEKLQPLIDQCANQADNQDTQTLPGPTGESNRLTTFARACVLCLGPGTLTAREQAQAVHNLGGRAVMANGYVTAGALEKLDGFSGVLWWGDDKTAREYSKALSQRQGAIIQLGVGLPDISQVRGERHLCIDTTAAGGNAVLLGGS